MKRNWETLLFGFLGIILVVILVADANTNKIAGKVNAGSLNSTSTPTANAFLPIISRQLPSETPTATATETPTPTPTELPVLTGNIDITDIHFNGSGSAEADEYVVIVNNDQVPIQLENWTLRDTSTFQFTFPNFVMTPGQVCRVYTNLNYPEFCGFNFGSTSPIWNNTGDTATLRDSTGLLIDQYSYTNP